MGKESHHGHKVTKVWHQSQNGQVTGHNTWQGSHMMGNMRTVGGKVHSHNSSCIYSVENQIGTLLSSSCQLRLGVDLSCHSSSLTLRILIVAFVSSSFSLFAIHSAVYPFIFPKSHFPKYSRNSFVDVSGNFTSSIIGPCFGIASINFSVFLFDSRHLAAGAFSFSVIDSCLRTIGTEISFLLFISLTTALSSSFVILSIMFCFLISSITIPNTQSGKSLSCCKKSEILTDLTIVWFLFPLVRFVLQLIALISRDVSLVSSVNKVSC